MTIHHEYCHGCQCLAVLAAASPCPEMAKYQHGVPPCPACYVPSPMPVVDSMLDKLKAVAIAASTAANELHHG